MKHMFENMLETRLYICTFENIFRVTRLRCTTIRGFLNGVILSRCVTITISII